MADVVNLNRFKKAKAKTEKAATAAHNRAKFGRAKAEKSRDAIEKTRAERELDGKKIDDKSED